MEKLSIINSMDNFQLSELELQQLRAAHKKARSARRGDARAAYKINAVILLGTGWSVQSVSQALLLDEGTLRRYIALYRDKGLTHLVKTFHQGSLPRLSEEQLAELALDLEKTPFLTSAQVCEHVNSRYGVAYSLSGITATLHRLGFSYRKPKVVPTKSDPEAQSFFADCYVDFMSKKQEDDVVLFLDAVHPVHNAVPAYGWFKKGAEAKELETNSARSRLNIHGAMNAETFETTVLISEENVDATSTVQLFEMLESCYPQASNIYVILDNARYHYCHLVKEKAANTRIQLVWLPSYSPELNMIERLWKLFKKKTLYNRFYETKKKFISACEAFFSEHKYKEDISSLIGEGVAAYSTL